VPPTPASADLFWGDRLARPWAATHLTSATGLAGSVVRRRWQ